jgi:hypothetical protein
MSETDSQEQQADVLTRAYRTVTPSYVGRPDREMDSIGWAIFLVMLALFVPLLPLVIVVWGVSKAVEAFTGRD